MEEQKEPVDLRFVAAVPPLPLELRAAATSESFKVSSYTLNDIEEVKFPGNISPEGYFYSPFYEVTLKELDDELQSITVKRINFTPSASSVQRQTVEFYRPEMGSTEIKDMYFIKIKSPISYNIIAGQPFCIYDIDKDMTYRGFLDSISGFDITVATEQEIDAQGLRGEAEGSGGKSSYIISLMEDNAPEYAEFLPATQKLVWRAPKKMSDLESDSPIYNMPFANGRLYIHQNLDVFVRRQDPDNDYRLFRPAIENPLRRFQIEGKGKLDLDYLEYITDSLVNAC